MALDFTTLSPEELLAAESAALAMRALLEAVKTAPHGHGTATAWPRWRRCWRTRDSRTFA